MAVKEWTTNYPTSQDTGADGSDQQPDLVNGDDDTRVSQIHAVRKKAHAAALAVGDASSLPAGCLKARMTTAEGSISSQNSRITTLEGKRSFTELYKNVPGTPWTAASTPDWTTIITVLNIVANGGLQAPSGWEFLFGIWSHSDGPNTPTDVRIRVGGDGGGGYDEAIFLNQGPTVNIGAPPYGLVSCYVANGATFSNLGLYKVELATRYPDPPGLAADGVSINCLIVRAVYEL